MLRLCPFCGWNLKFPIQDGISTCNHCHRVFDSCPYHRLLSAAWLVRKQNLYNIEAIKSSCEDLSDCELEILEKYIVDEDCSHDEFLKIINKKTCIDSSV